MNRVHILGLCGSDPPHNTPISLSWRCSSSLLVLFLLLVVPLCEALAATEDTHFPPVRTRIFYQYRHSRRHDASSLITVQPDPRAQVYVSSERTAKIMTDRKGPDYNNTGGTDHPGIPNPPKPDEPTVEPTPPSTNEPTVTPTGSMNSASTKYPSMWYLWLLGALVVVVLAVGVVFWCSRRDGKREEKELQRALDETSEREKANANTTENEDSPTLPNSHPGSPGTKKSSALNSPVGPSPGFVKCPPPIDTGDPNSDNVGTPMTHSTPLSVVLLQQHQSHFYQQNSRFFQAHSDAEPLHRTRRAGRSFSPAEGPTQRTPYDYPQLPPITTNFNTSTLNTPTVVPGIVKLLASPLQTATQELSTTNNTPLTATNTLRTPLLFEYLQNCEMLVRVPPSKTNTTVRDESSPAVRQENSVSPHRAESSSTGSPHRMDDPSPSPGSALHPEEIEIVVQDDDLDEDPLNKRTPTASNSEHGPPSPLV